MHENSLKRWRIQTIPVAIVWAVLAGVRIASGDHAVTAIVLDVVFIVVAIAFAVLFFLINIELRRRKAEQPR